MGKRLFVYAADVTAQVRSATVKLVHYIEQSTGVKVDVERGTAVHYILDNETSALFALRSDALQLLDLAGKDWTAIELFADIPQCFNHAVYRKFQIAFYMQNMLHDSAIYMDDVVVYEYPPRGLRLL